MRHLDPRKHSSEAFMRACMRPTEAACLHIQKCANNRQLIVASIQRFLRCAYTARASVSYIHAKRRVR